MDTENVLLDLSELDHPNAAVCYWLLRKAHRYWLAGSVSSEDMKLVLAAAVRLDVGSLSMLVGRI